jgi:hypothetical protein
MFSIFAVPTNKDETTVKQGIIASALDGCFVFYVFSSWGANFGAGAFSCYLFVFLLRLI